MPSPGEGDKLSFERDIRPLFRAKDRDSMLAAFDLFDYGMSWSVPMTSSVPCAASDAMRRRVARGPGRDAAAVDRRGHARLDDLCEGQWS